MYVKDLKGKLLEVKDVEATIEQIKVLSQFDYEDREEKNYWQHIFYELLKLKAKQN